MAPAEAAGPAGLVIFDLDGVLVDSRAAITTCINHALLATGQAGRDLTELERFVGPPLAEAFAELAGVEVADPLVEACIAAYRERYADDMVPLSRPFAGIPEVLAALSARHRLVVATSKPRAFALRLLEGHALLPWFAHVEGPGLDRRTEHKAETIARALQVGGPSGPAVMIGDRAFDVRGAHANGLPCIGVLWGIGDEAELAGAGASALVVGAADLPAAIGQVLAR
ncbi:MAG: HAD hydrolase-like protein [Solirubrobacteraceae bacterium]|nr:HAD hydrolase-like protein [Solirubrobacteraceae bacterium]